jgi:AcrR family transcriptional regulator
MGTSTKASPWGRSSRAQDRENKREAVLRTAARIFNERGYHGTSLELVAEELEITRPTVYYYFKNKDEILFECVRIALEMIEQASQEVTVRGGSAAEQLVAVMEAYAEVMMQDFGICLVRVGDSPLPAESRVKLRRLQANIDRKLRGLIEQGIRQKAFGPCDAKLAGFAVAGALNSIARWYRPDGELSPKEIAGHFVRILIGGLELRPPGPRLATVNPQASRAKPASAARVKKAI